MRGPKGPLGFLGNPKGPLGPLAPPKGPLGPPRNPPGIGGVRGCQAPRPKKKFFKFLRSPILLNARSAKRDMKFNAHLQFQLIFHL